ncbi:uncharacterized protein SCODWIG_00017 [Saccharomycodes ludwigii]|uniref:RRM domain-containing protein n=1 Tax=Saccharomycodes ludwigii TaxID=36035 RepID=A0A376B0P4_9ASCO|nr:hypothetical protein SCDLUD_003460 [Saccharomycodes ludwigii]KAH3900475.1 hypothetical protein SCDLUD_003460 [Saccharomycodes ludwigii]SSD58256.1 uncharacterized protein SCODWIG_00017 [Saccharomycodes ludwigii]
MEGERRYSRDYERSRSRSPARRNYYDDDDNNTGNSNNYRNNRRDVRRGSNNGFGNRSRGRGDRYHNDRYDSRGRGSGDDNQFEDRRRMGGRRRRDDGNRDRGRGRFNRGTRSRFNDRDAPPLVEGASYEDKMNRNYENSVFVGNLPYDCTGRDLEEHFSKLGKVIRADIITNRGRHRGMGTVEFDSRDLVSDAIKNFDRSVFMDREIFVREDNPPPPSLSNSREHYDDNSNYNNDYNVYPDYRNNNNTKSNISRNPNSNGFELFVANLPYSINWQALKDMFKECGNVTRADVNLDNQGRSRGFGTVYYYTREEAEDAIHRYNGYEMEGRRLDVHKGKYGWNNSDGNDDDYAFNNNGGYDRNRSRNYQNSNSDGDLLMQDAGNINNDIGTVKGAVGADDMGDESNNNNRPFKNENTEFTAKAGPNGEKSDTLYIQNLPSSTATTDLYDLFETIGKVNRAELKYNERNEPTGDAVIQYEDVDSAEICITRLNKYVYGGLELSISYVKYD